MVPNYLLCLRPPDNECIETLSYPKKEGKKDPNAAGHRDVNLVPNNATRWKEGHPEQRHNSSGSLDDIVGHQRMTECGSKWDQLYLGDDRERGSIHIQDPSSSSTAIDIYGDNPSTLRHHEREGPRKGRTTNSQRAKASDDNREDVGSVPDDHRITKGHGLFCAEVGRDDRRWPLPFDGTNDPPCPPTDTVGDDHPQSVLVGSPAHHLTLAQHFISKE